MRAVTALATLLTAAGLAVLPTATTAPVAAVEPVHARIVFDKDPDHPWRSRIVWKAWRGDRLLQRSEWRAGAGFGGKGTTDPCAKNIGWLPNGTYSFVQHDDYSGNLIKGRAFYLGGKTCQDGTHRTDLFIHTESGAGNTQCADTKGDQLCRWEYPKVNDYRSRGCIKMSPRDLRELVEAYQQWFDPGTRYATSRVQVRVRP